MKSVDLKNILAAKMLTIKTIQPIASTNGAAVIYYFRPSIKCRLVGAKVRLTATPTNDQVITFTKETLTAAGLLALKANDILTVSADISDAVANTAFMSTTSKATAPAASGANYLGAKSVIDGEGGEVLRIDIADSGSHPLAGFMELEFLPA